MPDKLEPRDLVRGKRKLVQRKENERLKTARGRVERGPGCYNVIEP